MLKLTSKSRREVAVMKSHARRNMSVEGKNPAMPVMTGTASIPAPIQLPESRRTPPRMLPDLGKR